MQQAELEKAILEFDRYMTQLTRDYSEPVTLTDQEMREYLNNTQLPGVDFSMVMGSVSNDVICLNGVKEHLPIHARIIHDSEYLKLIHPDYLLDYLHWAQAGYRFVDAKSKLGELETLRTSFRLTFPILKKNGEYWWVRMAVTILQLDKDNHVITHLNRYHFIWPFNHIEKRIPLMGEIWLEMPSVELAQWTRELRRHSNQIRSFTITNTERHILELVSRFPDYRSSDIASALNKKTNTIERHRRNIIAKAKEAFPAFEDRSRLTIKEIAQLLKDRQFLE
jgi:hypothetical protein